MTGHCPRSSLIFSFLLKRLSQASSANQLYLPFMRLHWEVQTFTSILVEGNLGKHTDLLKLHTINSILQ